MRKSMPIKAIKTDTKFQIFPANSDEVINAIQKDMRTNGFDEATPLVLWGDVVIDGHTRLAAAKEADLFEVPTIGYDFENEEDALDYAVHMQRDRRNLTDSDILFAVEKLDQRKERGENFKTFERNEGGHTINPGSTEVGTSGKQNKSHQQTADKIGIGKSKVQQVRTILDHADEKTKEEIKSNTKSINKAYEEVQEKRKVVQKEKKGKKFTETKDGLFIAKEVKKPTSSFNEQTNDNIEWAKWSWNPVTGCLHGCKYCYARDIANRFIPTKFAPTFYPDRLTAPSRAKIAAHRRDEEGINTVFVCSMADLFGDWVPQEWIDRVIGAVAASPEWNYIFLTKNPKRYIGIEWPDNAWVGTTIDIQKRVKPAIDAFSQINANIKFISCEPLSEHLQFNGDEYKTEGEWLEVFDWIIIGGQSESSRMRAAQPKWEWVESLHNQARNVHCPVYWKPNLTIRPKEYPENMKGGERNPTESS